MPSLSRCPCGSILPNPHQRTGKRLGHHPSGARRDGIDLTPAAVNNDATRS